MKKDILSINKNNYMDFINNYGFINDKETAIELLCLTSNAWLVLSDELKEDEEVIMYYQPVGRIRNSEGYDYGVFDEVEYWYDYPTDFSYLSIEEKEKLYAGTHESNHGGVCPNIVYPSDFDFITYFKIQYELSQKFDEQSVVRIDDKFYGKKIPELELYEFTHKEHKRSFHQKGDLELRERLCIYDRTRLKEIVKNLYNSNKLVR